GVHRRGPAVAPGPGPGSPGPDDDLAGQRCPAGMPMNTTRPKDASMTITTFGPVDARSLHQLETCMAAGDATHGVLCADHHPGYSQPIGGAVAYEGYVSPSGVGFDVGCGNKAVRTDLTDGDLDALGGVEPIMREVTRRISF